MSEALRPLAEWAAATVELIGVMILTLVAIYAVALFLFRSLRASTRDGAYRRVRQTLGRGILLGLELLVAADIIHTVAVDLTYRTVGVLAIVVLIRTFLSFTLELELSGRWPWQPRRGSDGID